MIRYFQQEGTFTEQKGSELTLIESEILAAVERDHEINLDPGMRRRDVIGKTISVNHINNKYFQLGRIVCLGFELYKPCSHIEQHLK